MAQKKLIRFAELKTLSNVLENPTTMQGQWNRFFKNDNEIVLELACGRGEYTIGLAKLYPQKNFIGVDIKGNRMYIGAKIGIAENLLNVAFLRTQIENINDYFAANEVSELWITFPDPQLRTSKAKKRLTHPRFLRKYLQILKPNGIIHLKTDSPALYKFTKKVIDLYSLKCLVDCDDIYAQANVSKPLQIKTHYEKLDIAQSNQIHYLQFMLPTNILNLDDQLQEILKITENNEA